MKKGFIILFLFLFLFFINVNIVSAKTINVKFSDCVDGDTAKFIYKDEKITARFLAIDTPETVHPTKEVEEYGKEASDYTCNKLKEANDIILEYDEDSDETDKYDRHLVWVFIDGELLQKKLVSKGLASVAYIYGDYKYTEDLELAEQEAEDNKLGIWSINQETDIKLEDEKNEVEKTETKESIDDINYKEIIMLLGIIILLCMFSSKYRKKVKNKIKKEFKKRLK